LQFLTPQENKERSNSRPCRIWEIGKKDAEIEYPSVVAAATALGYSPPKSLTTIHIKNGEVNICKNNFISFYNFSNSL
jgi:hypothetical protein